MNAKITETEEQRKSRWARFDALTDEQIDAAIAADPDAQVRSDAVFSTRGIVIRNNEVILPLTLDIDMARWLSEHHIDYQTFLNSVLKAYVESQQNV